MHIRKRLPVSAIKALLRFGFPILCIFVCVIAGCGASSQKSTSTSTSIILTYPQTSIIAVVGVAIQADTPAATGSVTGYSVAPTLPAGLSLNASTGAISGTPATVSPQASYTVTASNGTNSTTATVQITVNPAAPSNLSYPQTSITATVDAPIQTDTPTVTGTVTGYSVAPTLPAGLSLNSSTGAISGTPTFATAKASYTVTASNASGSTATTLQITVNPAAPSNLSYQQTSIAATAGTAILTDTPTVTGTVTGYSVAPALPAGLILNTVTGAISGTPTTGTVQANYTVTASNSYGSTTAIVSITVNQEATTLLDLGHASPIEALQETADRVLSVDRDGHWVLWDYASGNQVASGDGAYLGSSGCTGYNGVNAGEIALAGSVAAVQLGTSSFSGGIQVMSSTSGQTLSTIKLSGWWQLATDGSYLVAGSNAALTVWSTDGQEIFTVSGNYAAACTFSSPGQIQVANGAAGKNVIQTILVPSGAISVSPAFSGNFSQWFTDGSRFISALASTSWIYSNDGVQQCVLNATLNGGVGNWAWNVTTSGSPLLAVYPICSTTPSVTYSLNVAGNLVFPSGNLIGSLSSGTDQASVIDLSGSSPVETTYSTPPLSALSAFAAFSGSQWVGGDQTGGIIDGASAPSQSNASVTPRFFGYGGVLAMAGSQNMVVASTAIGKTLFYNLAGPTLTSTTSMLANEMDLSSDGSILGVLAFVPGNTLTFYSLPSMIPLYTYSGDPSANNLIYGFAMSSSATTIAQYQEAGVGVYQQSVTGISGSPDYLTNSDPMRNNLVTLSPDGTMIGVAALGGPEGYATQIYKNGALVVAIPGLGEGWIDNNDILVADYVSSLESFTYGESSIYSSTGAVVANVPIPVAISNPQFPSAGTVYSQTTNTIYSLTTGNVVWQGPAPQYPYEGVDCGSYICAVSGHELFVYSY